MFNNFQNDSDKKTLNFSDRNFSNFDSRNNSFMDDRSMFNNFSSNNQSNIETIDFSNDFLGMPVNNNVIYNNKKNLLSTPYIKENFQINELIKNDTVIEFDPIEKDILENEFIKILNNKQKFINFYSPFINSYIWKSLILLSKSPTTEQLLTVLNQPIYNKSLILNNMKNEIDFLKYLGTITYYIPKNDDEIKTLNTLNTKLITNMKDHYFLDIKYNNNKKTILYVNYLIDIPIPMQYNAKLLKINNINYLKLNNVMVYENELDNVINLEFNIGNNKTLGFIYNINNEPLRKINYDDIIKNKTNNAIIKEFIFPLIKYSKKQNYGKDFDLLEKIHLGEILYGKYLLIDIFIEKKINVSMIDTPIQLFKLPFIRNIFISNTFFYLKDTIENIGTKVIASGFICI